MSDQVEGPPELRGSFGSKRSLRSPRRKGSESRQIQDGCRAVSVSKNLKIHELSQGRWLAFVRLQNGGAASFFPIGPVGTSPEAVVRSLGQSGL